IPLVSMGKIFDANISQEAYFNTPPPTTTSNIKPSRLCGSLTYQNENSFRRLFFLKNNALNENLGSDANNIHLIGFEGIGEFRNLGFIWASIQKRTALAQIDQTMLMDNTIPLRLKKQA
ncbi:MAG: hypothetical protein QME51_05720, partial [Planctomycetota bacterium]|nr:hypothetical protein [Planctomycetota bacterium]MDI6787850.1 hypothetical protein [Planctomycetota bacterium]